MSFFAKGDFKIEESWDSAKRKSNTKKTTASRIDTNQESLMMKLANNHSDPTTDIIDDSLSRLLMKERGGIPTPAKKDRGSDKQIGKKPPQPNKQKKQSQEDKDLLASMANRLQQLQKTCQSQRLELKQQKGEIEKVKTENAFLKGMKQDSGKIYQQMNEIKKQNVCLKKKVEEMQVYLKEHGLKWVGNKMEGKLNADSIKKQIKDSKYGYRLPSEIDLATIQRRIMELNHGLEEQGHGTQIYNDLGVHKFRKTQYLPIAFYSNGIVAKGYNFYSYKSKQSLKILADIVDGYFPYIFKQKYPEGVLLQVVDKVQETYVQEKKETSINTFNSQNDKDFQPQSKQQFLKNLPKQVVKNGKVIPIRDEIQKIFDGKNSDNQFNENHVQKVDGSYIIKSPCYQKVNEGQISQQEVCVLKIRDQVGNIYLIHMFKNDKIIDVMVELRKVIRIKFKLLSNYPRRQYQELEEENLEELGFYPNANLHLEKKLD